MCTRHMHFLLVFLYSILVLLFFKCSLLKLANIFYNTRSMLDSDTVLVSGPVLFEMWNLISHVYDVDFK